MLFILILCYSSLFYANAQTIITSLNQTGYSADECLINNGEFTGASISGDIIIADGLDIPNVAFAINCDITSVKAAGNIGYIGMGAFLGVQHKKCRVFTKYM
ncbi:MAG: hypothetical protein FWG85_06230 [Bacteroidetes bacterium]|nr:hypothetical protein [Bacteroidota bacterium]